MMAEVGCHEGDVALDTVAIHLSHDSVLSVDVAGDVRNIELERIYSKRHYDVRHEGPSLHDLAALVQREHHQFHTGIVVGDVDKTAEDLLGLLGVTSIHQVDHHLAHAAAAFYESPFERSLIVSYDGGGNDGTFRTFVATRESGVQPLGSGYPLNLGIPYRALAHPIQDIKKPDDGRERSNGGKLMGLAAYGEIRPEWITPLTAYYRKCAAVNTAAPTHMYQWVVARLEPLGARLRLDLSKNALTGSDARDLARTAQHVFENVFLDTVLPIAIDQGLPICVTGGCALNVVTNQRLAESIDLPIFAPPNPNDSGLAQGALLFRSRPTTPATVTYSGSAIADIDTLPAVAARHRAVEVRPFEITQLLVDGCVVAVMRGNSEHGPRALGNRSILCNPRIPGMKARLNERVKFKEMFRPYAFSTSSGARCTMLPHAANQHSPSLTRSHSTTYRPGNSGACIGKRKVTLSAGATNLGIAARGPSQSTADPSSRRMCAPKCSTGHRLPGGVQASTPVLRAVTSAISGSPAEQIAGSFTSVIAERHGGRSVAVTFCTS